MTQNRITRIRVAFALCFLLLMLLFGGAGVYTFLDRHLAADSVEAAAEAAPTEYSFAELYPFPDSEPEPDSTPAEEDGLLSQYMSLVSYLKRGAAAYTYEGNPLVLAIRSRVSEYIRPILGNIILNGNESYVRLPNGYYTYIFPYSHSQESWESILDFSAWLKDRSIPLLTLITANKSDDSISEFPKGVPHGYAQMAEEYKAFLEENGLAYLDAKEVLLSEDSNLYSWFYRTDHHWNVHAGLLIAETLAEMLKKEFHLAADADAVKKENFTLTVYPDSFLGSMGKKLRTALGEDLEIYYPLGETDFHVEIPSLGIDKSDSFENTLIDQQYLSDSTSYKAFIGSGMPLVRIENRDCGNGVRVLLIRQSFANALCPYLACAVQYVDMIDPRSFDGSIRAFIEQTNPDIVITCANVIGEGDEHFWKLK